MKRPSTYLESKPSKRRRSFDSEHDASDADECPSSQPGPSGTSDAPTAKPSSFLNIAKELDLDEEDEEDEYNDSDDGPTSPPITPSSSRVGMRPKTTVKTTVALLPIPSNNSVIEASSKMKPSKKPHISDFAALGVSAPLIASLGAMSIRRPTPVQAACIPELLEGTCLGTYEWCNLF